MALGVTAGLGGAAVLLGEVGRVWRRGSAPKPSEAENLLAGAQEAVAETAQVAREGYRQVSSRENALFNLLGLLRHHVPGGSAHHPRAAQPVARRARSGACASGAGTSTISCPGS